jgi:dihydrodipicolinate synthase/N-acetylneuraminate lyase
MALPYTRGEVKERARSTWHGACNVTLPSFASDFTGLNPAGIQHDVRLAAEYGFWGTLVAGESGTTEQEYLEFLEIATDACPDDFRLVVHLSATTTEEMLRYAKAAETLGIEAALLSYPPTFRPRSAKDVVEYTRDLAEQTDLALILFAVETWGYHGLHPSGFPPEALEEMARFETAAAIKYEANHPGMVTGIADVIRRCGEHVLVQNPMEQHVPGLVECFGIQWIGTSSYETYGDRVPRWFDMLHEGKWDEALELYWSYQPGRAAKGAFHQTFGGANLIHRVGWKYLSWLQGFNGGLLRMPQMRLQPGQMRRLRTGLASSGFDLPEHDEGFYEGRHPA